METYVKILTESPLNAQMTLNEKQFNEQIMKL